MSDPMQIMKKENSIVLDTYNIHVYSQCFLKIVRAPRARTPRKKKFVASTTVPK